MSSRKHLVAAAVVAAIASPASARTSPPGNPSTDAIAALIAQRNAPRAGQGIVVGVIEPGGERVIADGPDGGPAGADTVFEIGSISKVFTALILADMANKGEVRSTIRPKIPAPWARQCPGAVAGRSPCAILDPSRGCRGSARTCRCRASTIRTSTNQRDARFPRELRVAARYRIAQFEYSNFEVELLGWLLGRAAGEEYGTLLRERITGPLGMRDTSVALSPEQQARFAQGFDPYMRPAKPWRFPRPGAGGIRSTLDDMPKFAAAALDPPRRSARR